MQVTRATFIPLLAAAGSDRIDPAAVRDEYSADLTVVYTFGPQFGRRVVTHPDLEQMELAPRVLRRSAFEHLEVLSSRAEFHGQPPALMLSFEGLESSLLLANDFWNRLQGAVPGELVVGVPARDVVIVTGSQSTAGLEKARRCVERVFMAGGDNPLTQSLLVRRGNTWEPFDRPARQGARTSIGPAHQLGQGQPPRQYQEHPSWPAERVPAVQQRRAGARPAAQPIAPAASLPPPRPAATTLPPVPGNLGAAGPAVAGPTSPMTNTGTGMPAVPAQVPRQRPAQGRRPQPAPDVSPYSAVPYSAMPYSSVPYSAVPRGAGSHSGAPQSGGPRSGVPHQAAMPYSAVPYSAPRSAVPYSAVPYSAVPYSAVPYSAAPNAGTQPARPQPVSHREADARAARSRSSQPSKPSYRDEPRREERPRDTWSGDDRDRSRDGRSRDDRVRDERGYDGRARDDRYRDDLYSTGSHTGPLYSPASSSPHAYPSPARGDGYDHQPEVPQPNYPDSWGWVPESATPRPQQHRPVSPRDRFSR